jgi:hypothetical protein
LSSKNTIKELSSFSVFTSSTVVDVGVVGCVVGCVVDVSVVGVSVVDCVISCAIGCGFGVISTVDEPSELGALPIIII